MSQAGLLIEDRQAVRWLTLHRPQAAHALDQSLHLALQEQLQIAVQEPRIQCVVLSASGADLVVVQWAVTDAVARAAREGW